MSNPTTLLAKLVPFTIGTDGVTYKQILCKQAAGFSIEPEVTEDTSDCGPHTAVGTSKWGLTVELLFNTTLNTGTEVSANELANWANNGTLVYIKVQYPTSVTPGSTLYIQGTAYISNYEMSLPKAGFISATATFRGDGVVDISA